MGGGRGSLVKMAVCVASMIGARSAIALPLAYESFDYSVANNVPNDQVDVDLNNNTGGFGFSGAWQGGSARFDDGLVVAPGLTYPGISAVGNAANFTGSGTGNGSTSDGPGRGAETQRTLASAQTTGAVVYVRYLVQRQTASEGGLFVELFGPTQATQLRFGQSGKGGDTDGKFALSSTLLPGSPLAVSNVTMGTGVTHLVVLRIDFGNNIRFRAYIDPESLVDETASVADLDYGFAPLPLFAGLAFGADGFANVAPGGPAGVDGVDYFSAASGTFDEIAIGTSYADVVPEPGCAAAVGFGVGVAVVRRKRRKEA